MRYSRPSGWVPSRREAKLSRLYYSREVCKVGSNKKNAVSSASCSHILRLSGHPVDLSWFINKGRPCLKGKHEHIEIKSHLEHDLLSIGPSQVHGGLHPNDSWKADSFWPLLRDISDWVKEAAQMTCTASDRQCQGQAALWFREWFNLRAYLLHWLRHTRRAHLEIVEACLTLRLCLGAHVSYTCRVSPSWASYGIVYASVCFMKSILLCPGWQWH